MKKRTTTAAKPVTRAKARSTSNGVASSRSKARRDTDLAPIVRFTPKQRAAYLEREVQSAVGISVAEFRRAFAAGEATLGTWMSSPSLRSWVSAGRAAKLSRSAAEGVAWSLAREMNHSLTWGQAAT